MRKKLTQHMLSVVVIMVGDTIERRSDSSQLAATLGGLANQIDAPEMEIIVPYHGGIKGIEELSSRFPKVIFRKFEDLPSLRIPGPSREHHDELRARGAALAGGEIVAFLEDHVRPEGNWAHEMVKAHHSDFAVIGGAIENAAPETVCWAAYFCDLGKYQNPVRSGAAKRASLVNASYKREPLERVRFAWQDRFNETTVNQTLKSLGFKLALSPRVVVHQRRENLRLATAVKEFYVWGRSFALTRGKNCQTTTRLTYAALTPALPLLFLFRMVLDVAEKRRDVGAFIKALPLIAIFNLCGTVGELAGYLTSSHSAREQTNSAQAVLEKI